MSTYSLSGSGTHALTASTTGLQVTITTPSSIGGVGAANPQTRYHQGLIRFSDGTAYWAAVPIVGGPHFIPVPANATSFGYAMEGGCVISVAEVIGGAVFFSAPTQSVETLSDVQISSIADGQVLEWIASASKWENRTPATGGAGVFSGHAVVQDQKASGTNGGTFSSGAWQTRTLNTLVNDTGVGLSLASNQITLPAGTYACTISAPGNQCDRHTARLQNITDAATLLAGTDEYIGRVAQSRSLIQGAFTLSAPKALEVQHRCQTSETSDGFGVAFGATAAVAFEVYTSVEIWKV